MIKVDWFEELGHNAIYIHVYEDDQNNTIWSTHDLKEIEDLVEDGFIQWEDDESIIKYLSDMGVIC